MHSSWYIIGHISLTARYKGHHVSTNKRIGFRPTFTGFLKVISSYNNVLQSCLHLKQKFSFRLNCVMSSSCFDVTGLKDLTTHMPHCLGTLPAVRVQYMARDTSIGFNWPRVKLYGAARKDVQVDRD